MSPSLEMAHQIYLPFADKVKQLQHIIEPYSKYNKQIEKIINGPFHNYIKQLAERYVPYSKYIHLQINHYAIVDLKFYEAFALLNSTDEVQIKAFIINFYTRNNLEELIRLFNEWKQDESILSKRLAIFEPCKKLLTISNSIELNINDIAVLVIPTLISQLEGILRDFYLKIFPNLSRERASPEKIIKEDAFWNNFTFAEIDNFITSIDNLFLSSLEISKKEEIDIEKYNLFRHKIMHGDPKFLDYGTEANLIRLVLYIDSCVKTIARIEQDYPHLINENC